MLVNLGPSEGGFQVQGAITRVFSLNAVGLTSARPIHQFAQPLTMTIQYDPAMDDAHQHALQVAFWDTKATAWVNLPSQIDFTAHTITATTTHFTDFSVISSTGQGPVWPQHADLQRHREKLILLDGESSCLNNLAESLDAQKAVKILAPTRRNPIIEHLFAHAQLVGETNAIAFAGVTRGPHSTQVFKQRLGHFIEYHPRRRSYGSVNGRA